MSSCPSVCQGLQSCLEPHRMEPRVLRLKLATPKPNPSPCPEMPQGRPCAPDSCPEEPRGSKPLRSQNGSTLGLPKGDQSSGDMGSWSFIQDLAHKSPSPEATAAAGNEEVYVHPLAKRSASRLSEKSLEMCTESLGSETGSDMSDSSDEWPSLSAEESEPPRSRERPKAGRGFWATSQKAVRSNAGRGFPPPLTSIGASSGCLRVRPHREDGRLVLKAVAVSGGRSFLAERSNGRLRLRMVKSRCDDEPDDEAPEVEAGDLDRNGEEGRADCGETEAEEEIEAQEETEEVGTGEDETEEEEAGTEDKSGDDDWDGDMEENCANVGVDIGAGKLPMLSCRGKWDPFWNLPPTPLPKPISQF